jgi:uncharacterized protein
MWMADVYLRTFPTDKGTMVACCDQDLLGRTFREGKLRLSLEAGFYGDTLWALEEALVLLDKADILNLAGKTVIDAAIERGIVHPEAVIVISGVPHVQVMRM